MSCSLVYRVGLSRTVIKSYRNLLRLSDHSSLFSTSTNSSNVDKKDQSKPDIKVTFIKANGQKIVGYGKTNENLLDVVINNHLDIDGFGACEGTLACSTCHLILKKDDFDKLKNKPTDEELDMLDLAFGLTETSRLGCQVYLTKEMDGLEVVVPETINDARTT
ncbi:adrenodoxin [Tetranychus urticae]|uniref:2Fe-2S ferredoxin-type domain-containing protein n=1 Tax=Tetranychus urticae TaxID=32264 RepID=T1KHB7_TETUR|nr:adrenodoxin [Tetranychus urticae]